MSESFEQWLVREIPPGTVISNPLWWAPKIRQALQSGEPVVPPQWRVVMRGMVEYAECNDPGNPYLDQAKALLSAGKGGGE